LTAAAPTADAAGLTTNARCKFASGRPAWSLGASGTHPTCPPDCTQATIAGCHADIVPGAQTQPYIGDMIQPPKW
jgi:hypothetical protein